MAPSSVLLQDEGEAKEDDAEEEEEKVVNVCGVFDGRVITGVGAAASSAPPAVLRPRCSQLVPS